MKFVFQKHLSGNDRDYGLKVAKLEVKQTIFIKIVASAPILTLPSLPIPHA